MEAISAAEAKSRFSELISRASAGERFVIRRRERPVAVLISPDELERLERASSAARRLALALGQDKELLARIELKKIHPIMAAFGLWRHEDDLAHLVDEIYASRDQGDNRPEVQL